MSSKNEFLLKTTCTEWRHLWGATGQNPNQLQSKTEDVNCSLNAYILLKLSWNEQPIKMHFRTIPKGMPMIKNLTNKFFGSKSVSSQILSNPIVL